MCAVGLFRASDKRRNIAAQKAEAQRRLFRSHKKVEQGESTEMEKKKQELEKRKDELVGGAAQVRGHDQFLNERFAQRPTVVLPEAQFNDVAVSLSWCLCRGGTHATGFDHGEI